MDEAEASPESPAPNNAPAPPQHETPAPDETKAQDQTPADDEAPAGTSESAEAATPEAEMAPESVATAAAEWSHLRAFQSVEAPPPALGERPDYAEELAKEFGVRAARFARSVDESIVLSSDGVLRWLGDPIARVVAGEKLLDPRVVLLADEALTGEERQSVETRANLWLGAHIRKVLGPLLALSEGAELPEPARALGARIAEALGVLEREAVRNDVRALEQTARGALRKLGVRFGSLYIYVPALLKPAARGLSSLLWTLKRGQEAGADRLLGFAAAGRTSFANEGLLPPDSYRVAGFRLCGERVVRVDIIERLSDLIRAALPDAGRGGGRGSEAHGFLVTPQMTSLTGCSGEAFASILRSLGFEPAKVTRAAYEAARPKAPTEPVKPATEAPGPAEGETAQSTAPEVEAADTAEAAPVGETDVVATPTSEAETEEAHAEAPAAIEAAAPENVAAEIVDTEPAEPATVEAEAEAAASDPAEAGETTAVVAAEGAEEEIEVWRPIPRRPRAPRHGHGAQARPQGQQGEASGESHRGRRDRGRRGPRPEGGEARPQEAAPAMQERPERKPEGPRRFEGKPREERDNRKPFPPRRESRPPDPDSPFAKLAALKPLLERRDKRP